MTYALGATLTVEIADVAMTCRMIYFKLTHEERERMRKARRPAPKKNSRDARKGRKGGRR